MLSFRYFITTSVSVVKNKGELVYSDMNVNFSNLISPKNQVANEGFTFVLSALNFLEKKSTLSKQGFKDILESTKNADFIDSNGNLELVYIVLREYGFSDRFIIKEIFGGENFKGIKFVNSDGEEDYIQPFIHDHNKVTIFKWPVNDPQNVIRIIGVLNHESGIVYPLFLDTQHNLFTGSPSVDIKKTKEISDYLYLKLSKKLLEE